MADDTGNTTDTARRFEIYVPSPKARINLGAPNKDSTGPFGYTGVSIQSDVHLFIDANKHTLFQTGQNYCGQVGGKWLQYSNSDMIMSSTANMNVSADKKVLLAAGSGQGQITAIDHGTFPRVVPYNALALAYRVDRVQVGLFEFFHGRRKRADYGPKFKAFLAAGGIDDTGYFDADEDSATEEQTEADLKGGFLTRTAKSLRELFPVAAERELGKYEDDAATEPDPIVLLDPLVMKKVVGKKDDATKLLYGFTPYFNRFDPYALIDLSQVEGFIAKGLARFRNGLAWMRRFADVCTKYAYLITDNKLGERAQKLMGAVDNLAKATWHAYHFVELPFGHFLPGHDRGIGSESGGGFRDEAKSGMKARFGGSDPTGDAADAIDKERAKLKAKVTSSAGPFDLSARDPSAWTLTITTDHGYTKTITLGGSAPSRAELSGTASADALLPAELDVTVTRPSDGSVPGWITDAQLDAWVSEALGIGAPPASWTAPVTVAADVMLGLLTVPGTDATSIYQQTRVFEEAATGATSTLTLAQIAAFAPVHRSEVVRIAVDGVEATVTLRSADVSFSDSRLAADRDYVRAQLSSAVSGAGGTVSGSGEAFLITSGRLGSQAELLVIDGANVVLRSLGLRRAQREVGSDGSSGLSGQDLTAVTADQIVAEIGSGAGFTASVDGGAVKLESKHAPNTSTASQIGVTGTLASFFSPSSDRKTWHETVSAVTDQGAAGTEAFYKSLISWNHELQKLPEDTRNLTRPIRNAINDVVASATALEQAAEGIADLVGKAEGLPSPPEAIGLIADEGISLGTRDRIVGAGGKGIVFIADGGSGHEDHNRFIPKVEQFVNLSMAFDPLKAAVKGIKYLFGKAPDDPDPPDPEPSPSLGFRVLSDSTVDLMGTGSAQLMALGRGKLTAAGPDGEQIVGTGIARVAGSYATEVAAYRKVVISARNPGSDDKTGGRVEVAGQTIAIGGMNLANDTKDFDSTKDTLFGIAPLSVSDFAGAEHLSATHKDAIKKELLAHAWPTTLRDGGASGHPDTQRVFVHAAKETVIQVGAFLVHVDATKGVVVGTRKPSPDPTVNEVDEDKPRIALNDAELAVYANKDTRTFWDADGVGLFHKDGAGGASVVLENAKVTMSAGTQDSITIKNGETTLSSAKVGLLGKSAVEIKADGTIKIG